MGRPPLHDKPIRATERKRLSRPRLTSAADRAGVRRAFELAGAHAQALFIKWLRKMKLID